VTSDREALAALVDAVDGFHLGEARASIADAPAFQMLRTAADRARRHLAEPPTDDCEPAVERASRAAYAAGVAHGADSQPDRRQGATVDE
jgi:hypothetical protein